MPTMIALLAILAGCGSSSSEPDLTGASVDTSLDRATVMLQEPVQITCAAKDSRGTPIEVETDVTVDPDPGAALADHVLRPASVGKFHVACRIRDTTITDLTPAELFVTPGVPVRTRVDLSKTLTAAGEAVQATCVVLDAHGNAITDLGTRIDALTDLVITDTDIRSTRAGTYAITCSLAESDPPLDRTPAILTVTPAAPSVLRIVADPDLPRYQVNDRVDLSFAVADAYGNAILGMMVAWTPPSGGVNVSPAGAGLAVSFLQEGAFPFTATLNGNVALSNTLWLFCDTQPPDLLILTPPRGATLQGTGYDGPTVTVTGTVADHASGLQSLRINGILADVGPDGDFSVALAPQHGLNVIEAEAMDRAGLTRTRSQGFYFSTAYVPFTDRPDHEGEWVSHGLTAFMSQATLDDQTRHCAFSQDTPPSYRCQAMGQEGAYDDVATVLEVVLNNLDLSGFANAPLYDSGQQAMLAHNLTPNPVDIDLDALTDGAVPYKIRGVFILTGTFQVTSDIASIDWGTVLMGDPESAQPGLDARDNGMDLRAWMGPDAGHAQAISAALDLNAALHFGVGFSIDARYNRAGTPNNGIYEHDGDSWVDVSAQACGGAGVLVTIDTLSQVIFGQNPNFYGYVCEQDDMAADDAQIDTGASLSAERVGLFAEIDLGMAPNERVDVTVNQVTIDFQDGAVTVDEIAPLTVNLGNVVMFGGVIDWSDYLPGGASFQINSFQPFLADFLSGALTHLQDLITPVLDELFVCGGTLECAFDVSTFLENAINSVAVAGRPIDLPGLIPGSPPRVGTFASRVDELVVSDQGLLLDLSALLEAPRDADGGLIAPLGSILRMDCGQGPDLFQMPMTHPMEAALHLDLVNQAIYAFWWAGGLSTQIDANMVQGDLPPGITGLRIRTAPMLPPILTDCQKSTRGVHLQIADLEIDATVTIDGQEIPISAWLQADLEADVKVIDGRLAFDIDPGFAVIVVDITRLGGDLAGQDEAVVALIRATVLDLLVHQGAATGVAGVPLPALDLDTLQIPGLPEGLDIQTHVISASIGFGRILILPTL